MFFQTKEQKNKLRVTSVQLEVTQCSEKVVIIAVIIQ